MFSKFYSNYLLLFYEKIINDVVYGFRGKLLLCKNKYEKLNSLIGYKYFLYK